ncbi:MAG: SDR family oxidoreductase [Rhodocyclales bacterium]|nr:SDR family oxidoreductase [Rhodocyclales bacterium]
MAAVTVILSASSDIGLALAQRRLAAGDEVWGTYRRASEATRALVARGARLVEADFSDPASVQRACRQLAPDGWDELVLAPGMLEPVGPFVEADFARWEQSLDVNLVQQARATHALLPRRRDNAMVLFFAGGGSNSAPPCFSAYTLSKVALIKLTELLQAELPDTRVCILGPGWVNTKIHQETLRAGGRAGEALAATRDRLARDAFVPMADVLDCIDWLRTQPREVIGGRNFSVAHDPWRDPAFAKHLADHPDHAKLRRAGNDAFLPESPRA